MGSPEYFEPYWNLSRQRDFSNSSIATDRCKRSDTPRPTQVSRRLFESCEDSEPEFDTPLTVQSFAQSGDTSDLLEIDDHALLALSDKDLGRIVRISWFASEQKQYKRFLTKFFRTVFKRLLDMEANSRRNCPFCDKENSPPKAEEKETDAWSQMKKEITQLTFQADVASVPVGKQGEGNVQEEELVNFSMNRKERF